VTTHALEDWGNARGAAAASALDPVAFEDRLAAARSRRARALAARDSEPHPGPTPLAARSPARRRRFRAAILLPVFATGLAAGIGGALVLPLLTGPPPLPPPVVQTAAALVPPPASLAAPRTVEMAGLSPTALPALAPLVPAAQPAVPRPRPAAGPRPFAAPSTVAAVTPPARFARVLGIAVPPGPVSTSPAGFDPGHLAPSVRAAFPPRSAAPVSLAALADWPRGVPTGVPARATASARSGAAQVARPRNPIEALFRAIGRLTQGQPRSGRP
jgi:hypothetical protein